MKYKNGIQIKKYKPKIKITNIDTEDSTEDIEKQIIKQNDWLSQGDFEIAKIYTVTTLQRTYKKLIIHSKLNIHEKILTISKGYINFNFTRKRCYEYVNLTQCFNCSQYGH